MKVIYMLKEEKKKCVKNKTRREIIEKLRQEKRKMWKNE